MIELLFDIVAAACLGPFGILVIIAIIASLFI